MTIPEKLKKKLLEADSFGHEMRVGNILNLKHPLLNHFYNATFMDPLEHGGSYIDSITAKRRQFDFRARVYSRPGHGQFVKYALLGVECKNLHSSSPLVVCGRARTSEESYYMFIESRRTPPITEAVIKRADYGQFFYSSGNFVGKTLNRFLIDDKGEVKPDTSSTVYDGWSQAISSCVDLAQSATRFALEGPNRWVSVIIPIVVVPDGALWTMAYKEDGTVEADPGPVDSCEYYLAAPIKVGTQDFILTHVHFLTLKGLSGFLSKFWENRTIWDWMFPTEAETVGSPDMIRP